MYLPTKRLESFYAETATGDHETRGFAGRAQVPRAWVPHRIISNHFYDPRYRPRILTIAPHNILTNPYTRPVLPWEITSGLDSKSEAYLLREKMTDVMRDWTENKPLFKQLLDELKNIVDSRRGFPGVMKIIAFQFSRILDESATDAEYTISQYLLLMQLREYLLGPRPGYPIRIIIHTSMPSLNNTRTPLLEEMELEFNNNNNNNNNNKAHLLGQVGNDTIVFSLMNARLEEAVPHNPAMVLSGDVI